MKRAGGADEARAVREALRQGAVNGREEPVLPGDERPLMNARHPAAVVSSAALAIRFRKQA